MSDYGFAHEGRIYTPNGTPDVPVAENDARNAAIEAAELAYWRTAPARMVAYYKFADDCRASSLAFHTARTLSDCTVATWRGVKLGTITRAKVYRHNFGGRMVSIRVMGTNGHEYHGRASYDWGTVITLRRCGRG